MNCSLLSPAMMLAVLVHIVHGTPVRTSPRTEEIDAPLNIIITLVDDLGYADMGYKGGDFAGASPFIDSLANNGVKFDNHYVQSVCSPTRACLLTGRYAHRVGFQQGVIFQNTRDSLDVSLNTLADELQGLGYRTMLGGKWHLGNANWNMVPNQRGFDVYNGYYAGGMDYFTKEVQGFRDLHNNNDPETNPAVTNTSAYSQYYFRDSIEDFIDDHASTHGDKPFFIYNAMQTVHTPLQATDDDLNHPVCAAITLPNRRLLCAMVVATDRSMQAMFDKLQEHGYDSNTLLIFSADNGGQVLVGGDNAPLRGGKAQQFEGGIRSLSFAWGNMLSTSVRGTTYSGLLHITDWMPTIMGVVTNGTWTPSNGAIDGLDVWDAVTKGRRSPRTELVHNYDSSENLGSAIRVGDYKLILSELSAGPRADNCHGFGLQRRCDYLFNIAQDPNEQNNLILTNPKIASKLSARLAAFGTEEAPCATCGAADPAATDKASETGYWTPWLGTKPTTN